MRVFNTMDSMQNLGSSFHSGTNQFSLHCILSFA